MDPPASWFVLAVGGALQGLAVGAGAYGCAMAAYWFLARHARGYGFETLDWALQLSLALPVGFIIAWIAWLIVDRPSAPLSAIRTVAVTALLAIPIAALVFAVLAVAPTIPVLLIAFPPLVLAGAAVMLVTDRVSQRVR